MVELGINILNQDYSLLEHEKKALEEITGKIMEDEHILKEELSWINYLRKTIEDGERIVKRITDDIMHFHANNADSRPYAERAKQDIETLRKTLDVLIKIQNHIDTLVSREKSTAEREISDNWKVSGLLKNLIYNCNQTINAAKNAFKIQ